MKKFTLEECYARNLQSFYPAVVEAVDLGLSVKWANTNLGAKTPESFGDYYAWGELKTKSGYSWSNYKWCKGTSHSLTKYCYNSDYGVFDRKTWWLDKEDDIANVILGGKWHIPNRENWQELRHDCIWTWKTLNGVNGYLINSKIPGFTDKSIFLPAAGYKEDTRLEDVGYRGLYWSSSLYMYHLGPGLGLPYVALCADFNSRVLKMLEDERILGCTIRPVLD